MGQNFESKVRYSLVSMRYGPVTTVPSGTSKVSKEFSRPPFSPTSRRQLGKRERLETWPDQVHKLR